MRKRRIKIESKSSPNNSRRGCLGPNGKYHTKWCNGELGAQGIGSLKNQNNLTISKPNN